MSFLNVYKALHTTLQDNRDRLGYVGRGQFIKGYKDPLPQQEYTVILEPGPEEEHDGSESHDGIKEVTYSVDIYARLVFITSGTEGLIVGKGNKKGVLAFVDDIKQAIRDDLTLGYTRQGFSTSKANSSATFALTSSARYLTVSINGKTPTGYTQIDCGASELGGDEVAANIQTSLQALGNYKGDGYDDATCTFDSDTKMFSIQSSDVGPSSSVVVTAGATLDCSALLGFNQPYEVIGRNIVSVKFGTVVADNTLYPVRYRIIPVQIREEVLVE